MPGLLAEVEGVTPVRGSRAGRLGWLSPPSQEHDSGSREGGDWPGSFLGFRENSSVGDIGNSGRLPV